MGLEHNTATFKKYTVISQNHDWEHCPSSVLELLINADHQTIMSKCAHECFPEALPLGQQPPNKVKLYMEKVRTDMILLADQLVLTLESPHAGQRSSARPPEI